MTSKHVLAFVIVVVGVLAARAEETEVLFDGAGLDGWDTSRDQERLKREFAVSELTAVGSPPALASHFLKLAPFPVAEFRVLGFVPHPTLCRWNSD
jgi:hypothetical protein